MILKDMPWLTERTEKGQKAPNNAAPLFRNQVRQRTFRDDQRSEGARADLIANNIYIDTLEDDEDCYTSESLTSSSSEGDSIKQELKHLKLDELTNLKALKLAVR